MADVSVMVTHRVPGFHYWPDAPPEVAYLANLHRHLFLIIVTWPVKHDDREIEFHIAQQWVRSFYKDAPINFGHRSCEMIARDLYGHFAATSRPTPSAIEVWEDEECGARVVL